MRAVVDRIEGSTAVLLVGSDETPVSVPLRELPQGTSEGTVLDLLLRVDHDATRDALSSARARIDRLKDLSKRR